MPPPFWGTSHPSELWRTLQSNTRPSVIHESFWFTPQHSDVILTSELDRNLMRYATHFWAKTHLPSYAALFWNLLRYARPFWATGHVQAYFWAAVLEALLSCAAPFWTPPVSIWAMQRPSELRPTSLSYATPFRATPHILRAQISNMECLFWGFLSTREQFIEHKHLCIEKGKNINIYDANFELHGCPPGKIERSKFASIKVL